MSEDGGRISEIGDRDSEERNKPFDPRSSSAYPRVGGARLGVLLYQPEIPQNTGNIARTCAATHTPLYLVEPLGFRITDKLLKRAGLDYWPYVRMKLFADFGTARRDIPRSRMVYFSAHAPRPYYDFSFQPGTAWFWSRNKGPAQELLANHPRCA